MGSRKNKKLKQEEVDGQEVVEIDKPKRGTTKRKLVPENENTIEILDSDVPTKPKKKKRKNKIGDDSQLSSPIDLEETGKNGIIKPEVKEEETMELTSVEDLKLEDFAANDNNKSPIKKGIMMPQNDQLELCRRIELLIPQNDSLSFRSRLEKLDWNDIVFSHYSVSECKEAWKLLQGRIRRFRLLQEVLSDAKKYIQNPPDKDKKKMYSDMPHKPPSNYQIFYKKKKPILQAKSPGMEFGELSKQISQMFKNLSAEKKAKYDKLAAQAKAKYDADLEEFYQNHPELERLAKKTKKSEKPKKPRTPFSLYFENYLKKTGNSDTMDVQAKTALKDQCKEHWKRLSVKKKVLWITKAEQDVLRYQDEVKEYLLKDPSFIPVTLKHILSKEELALKDKFQGKPDKPPNSAYSLFSRNMLQSDEIKKINAKERMNFISNAWKNCPEDEKSKYKQTINELVEQYKKDYMKYLDSLPEDKRQLEIQKNAPKKRQKVENPDDASKKKAKKGKIDKVPEPAPPPISAFRYFANVGNHDDKSAKKAWKKLSEQERSEYEKKLVEIKREYILEFEKFLNSLSKEELEVYSKTKQELQFNSEDFVDEDSSSSSSDEENNSDDDSD